MLQSWYKWKVHGIVDRHAYGGQQKGTNVMLMDNVYQFKAPPPPPIYAQVVFSFALRTSYLSIKMYMLDSINQYTL